MSRLTAEDLFLASRVSLRAGEQPDLVRALREALARDPTIATLAFDSAGAGGRDRLDDSPSVLEGTATVTTSRASDTGMTSDGATALARTPESNTTLLEWIVSTTPNR